MQRVFREYKRGDRVEITYSENNTHIVDSYKAKDINLEVMEIIRERNRRKLPVTRSFESYVREWRGHNRLYYLHLFRSHTKDVDLDENMSMFWELIWLIIGGI